jgi:hypothetical protein
MGMKHVQAELQPHEYAALQEAVRAAGLTLKDGVREAVLSWVRARRAGKDPFYRIKGIAGRAGSRDASERHDDLYLED